MSVTITAFPSTVHRGQPFPVTLKVVGLFQRLVAKLSDGSQADLVTPTVGARAGQTVDLALVAWTLGPWSLTASALDPQGCEQHTTLARLVTVMP